MSVFFFYYPPTTECYTALNTLSLHDALTLFTQGSYETSNVQSMKQMTQMIETVRAYTSVAKMVEAVDETRGKAIQQLGRMEN